MVPPVVVVVAVLVAVSEGVVVNGDSMFPDATVVLAVDYVTYHFGISCTCPSLHWQELPKTTHYPNHCEFELKILSTNDRK